MCYKLIEDAEHFCKRFEAVEICDTSKFKWCSNDDSIPAVPAYGTVLVTAINNDEAIIAQTFNTPDESQKFIDFINFLAGVECLFMVSSIAKC